jgi:hypothetical protein
VTTSRFLAEHGTRAFELKPGSIVQAAVSDLKLRARKTPGEGVDRDPELQGRQYAFVGKHVRRAKTPAELIQLALDHPEAGVTSGKINTKLIYREAKLLQAALAMAAGA